METGAYGAGALHAAANQPGGLVASKGRRCVINKKTKFTDIINPLNSIIVKLKIVFYKKL